jgi:hypothetical protein
MPGTQTTSTSFGPLLCACFPRSPSLTPSPLLSSTPYPPREQWLTAVVGWLLRRGGCHGVTVLVTSLPEDASTHVNAFSFIPGKHRAHIMAHLLIVSHLALCGH